MGVNKKEKTTDRKIKDGWAARLTRSRAREGRQIR
jgi:hypothetical protein